jgi:flagellar hook-basal body complex protein FliE
MKINEFVPNSKLFDMMDSKNVQSSTENTNKDFGAVLMEKLDGVNKSQLDAENATESFIKGDNIDVQNVMLSTEEAKMSLELAVQVRNKLVDAYQEFNKMQF